MTNTTTTLEINSITLIYLFAFSGIAFAGFCTHKILSVVPKITKKKDIEHDMEEDHNVSLIAKEEVTQQNVDKMESISKQIAEGSDVFLFTEYLYLLIFVVVLALIIFFVGEKIQWTAYTTIAFICGSFTSMLCGFLGMKIAVKSNYRTTYSAL
jgi:hypothetical protein